MGKTYVELDERLAAFIAKQHLFFVATAPSSVDGHVNVSPKGHDSLRILDGRRVAYLDYPGSGIETVAHVKENGRIVLMLCSFSGAPNILRLYGKGRVIEPHEPDFEALLAHFEARMPPRAIVEVTLDRIQDACGYAVPLYEYQGERDTLQKWCLRKHEALEMGAYQRQKNSHSIDGLPGLDADDAASVPELSGTS